MGVGPAHVHPLEHLSPVLGLGAPGAGVDLDVAVVAVGLARQQRFQLGAGGPLLQARQLLAHLFKGRLVALGVGKLGELQGVGELGLQLVDRLHLGGQAVALAHQGLGVVRTIPQGGILRARVQLIELPKGRFPVKVAS